MIIRASEAVKLGDKETFVGLKLKYPSKAREG